MPGEKKGRRQDTKGMTGGSAIGQSKVLVVLGIIVMLAGAIVLFVQYNEGGSLFPDPSVEAKEKAREYDAYAGELLEPIKVEMAKPVSPYKFMLNSIEEVETLLWKGLDLDTTMTTAWEKLGFITAQFHGKQALMRYESYTNQGKLEEATIAEREAIVYLAQADVYYDKALEFGHTQPDRIYFLKAEAAAIKYDYRKADELITQAILIDTRNKKYRAKVAEYNLYGGRFDRALERLEEYKTFYPEDEFAYRNLGGFYMFRGDTAIAIPYYMEAAERGTQPEVGKFLYKYFRDKGDAEKSEYYRKKAIEAEVNWKPDPY